MKRTVCSECVILDVLSRKDLESETRKVKFMIGYLAGILTTIAFAPQLLRALTSKSTKDISLVMLLCSTSGMFLWMLHGILVKDPALIAANSISFVLAFVLLGLKLKNDHLDFILKLGKKPEKFGKNSLSSHK